MLPEQKKYEILHCTYFFESIGIADISEVEYREILEYLHMNHKVLDLEIFSIGKVNNE